MRQNESYSFPDKGELTKWARTGLCRIGAQGQFHGDDANKYYENPLATEQWVMDSTIDESSEGGFFAYHNLKISWEAKMWKTNPTVH